MQSSDTAFTGSVPEVYDSHLVPLIFADLAGDLARRAAEHCRDRVLELAAGTGVVSRALAPRLRPDARYWVTDLNPDMLAKARELQEPDPRISFEIVDAMDIGFEDRAFDTVLCQFGVMFFPDRVKAYREIRRVLGRGGTFLFNAWDDIAENHVPDLVTATLAEMFPDNPPLFMARVPHGYHDIEQIYADIEAAGFAETQIDTLTLQSRAPSARHAAMAFCQGTPLRGMILEHGADKLEEATDRCTRAIADLWGEGPFTAQIQAHVVTARA